MLLSMILFVSVHSWVMEAWPEAATAGPDGRLLQAHVIYRHGHREPKSFYPADPHAASQIWNNGPTQLTILGRQQGYLLGRRLRSRYRSLLPKNRAWKAVRATSSDTARTLMTSAAVLAGLLPPGPEDEWCNMTWQPVAIHTSPSTIDNLLGARTRCPQYDRLLDALPKETDEETQRLYYSLSRYTGKAIASSNALLNLYTCLEIESQAGLDLPEWTSPIYNQIRNHATRALLRMTRTLELKRLRSGPLIKKITNFQRNKTMYNIQLYCTHDSVLAGLMASLGLEPTEPPSFTATFIVEYRERFGEIHAQLWFGRGAAHALTRLRLPGCGPRCPLRTLRRIVDPLVPLDWTAECHAPEHGASSASNLQTTFVTLLTKYIKRLNPYSVFVPTSFLIGLCVVRYIKNYEDM